MRGRSAIDLQALAPLNSASKGMLRVGPPARAGAQAARCKPTPPRSYGFTDWLAEQQKALNRGGLCPCLTPRRISSDTARQVEFAMAGGPRIRSPICCRAASAHGRGWAAGRSSLISQWNKRARKVSQGYETSSYFDTQTDAKWLHKEIALYRFTPGGCYWLLRTATWNPVGAGFNDAVKRAHLDRTAHISSK